MFCRNCQQDTGNRNECPHCGYNPALDAEGAVHYIPIENVKPRPVRITLKKIPNKKATASLVLAFFGVFIIPGIISFFMAISGFFQAKKCRCGRGKAIAAFIILAFWTFFYYVLIQGILNA